MGENTPKIVIPDHILDMIPVRAAAYAAEQKERWLAGLDDDAAAAVEVASTHNIADTAERRELHRAILTELAANVTGEMPEKPTMVYVAGPMAVGKSSLLRTFGERMERERQGAVEVYDHQHLEAVYQDYKAAMQHYMTSDFALYKARLPEFAESGNNFAIIRPEASALDQAARALAAELKASVVMEQLGDGDMRAWAKEQTETYRLVAIGVTADPNINQERLHARNESTGQEVTDEELARTISGFSDWNAFMAVMETADRAVLVNADWDELEVVYGTENGEAVCRDPAAYGYFLDNAGRPANELFDDHDDAFDDEPEPEAPGL